MRRGGLAVVLAALAVSGCSVRADIEVTGPLERPRAMIVDHGGARTWRTACVERVEVRREGDRWSEPYWSIQAVGEGCLWLEEVSYGETPQGFTRESGPGRLEPGVPYEVFIQGSTRGLASVPWVAGGWIEFANGGWRVAPWSLP